MAANTVKTYGKQVEINGDIEIAGVILSDISATPAWEINTYGKPEQAATRRLVSVDYSGTATFLKGTTEAALETAVETWAKDDAPARYPDTCPAGGSVVIELGQSSIVPGDAKTVQFTAKYYPLMTANT